MGKMNELDLCIQEVAMNDKALRDKITDEIELHLNGLLPYDHMSPESQKAICMFEEQNKAEQSYHEGHLGAPIDIDDIPLNEEEI